MAKTMQKKFALHQKPEQRLENQLALLGVRPEQIKTIVLSHLHLDHTGGLPLFPHAEVFVPKADYISALLAVHTSSNPEQHGGYIWGDLTAPLRKVHLVEEEFELYPGISLINLPGHTPGAAWHARKGSEKHLPSASGRSVRRRKLRGTAHSAPQPLRPGTVPRFAGKAAEHGPGAQR